MMSEIIADFRDLLSKLLDSPPATVIGSLFLGLIHQLFGDVFLPAHSAIIILILADWGFGLSYAIATRQVSSDKSFRGILKLLLYGGVFVVGAQLQKVDLVGPFFNGFLIGLMIMTEAVSVLENIDRWAKYKSIDLPWLEPLIQVLKQRRKQALEGGEVRKINERQI